MNNLAGNWERGAGSTPSILPSFTKKLTCTPYVDQPFSLPTWRCLQYVHPHPELERSFAQKVMPLRFTLHKNAIHRGTSPRGTSPRGTSRRGTSRRGGSAESYRAVAKNINYIRVEDAIEALTQSGSILKETECFAVIHGFLNYLNEQLAEGNGFLSPYFRLTPGVRGVFDGEEDNYDPQRHRPSVNFRQGKKMQQAMQRMKMLRVDSEVPAPIPHTWQDWKSHSENKQLTPGQVGVVAGEQLKVENSHDPAQGVFFTHLPTQQTYRAEGIFHNYPKQLMVPIPEGLPAGLYELEVRSAYGNGTTIRSGRLPHTLTVG